MKNYELCNNIIIGSSNRLRGTRCCTKQIRWFDKDVETNFTLDEGKNSIDNSVDLFNKIFPKRELYLMSAKCTLKTWLIKNFEKNNIDYEEFASFYRENPESVWEYGIFDELLEEIHLSMIALGNEGEVSFFFSVDKRSYDLEVSGKVDKGFTRVYKRSKVTRTGLFASVYRNDNFPNLYRRIPKNES